MAKRSISEELARTFEDIGTMVADDRAGEASHQALERTAYLGQEIDQLCRALRGLQRACTTAARHCSHPEALDLWADTCRDLSAAFPAGFSSLGGLLVSAERDLLQIVAYTSAAHALVAERTRQLVRLIGEHIRHLVGSSVLHEDNQVHHSDMPLGAALTVVEGLDSGADLATIADAWEGLDRQLEFHSARNPGTWMIGYI